MASVAFVPRRSPRLVQKAEIRDSPLMRQFRISLAEGLDRITRLRQDFSYGHKVTEEDWPAVMRDTDDLVGMLVGLMILRGSLDLVHMQTVYMDQLNGYAEIARRSSGSRASSARAVREVSLLSAS